MAWPSERGALGLLRTEHRFTPTASAQRPRSLVSRSLWIEPPAPAEVSGQFRDPTSGPGALEISVSAVAITSLRWSGTLPGVQIDAVGGLNGPGRGRLWLTGSGTQISWQAPGGSSGPWAPVQSGSCLLTDNDTPGKWIAVTLYPEWIPAANQSASVFLLDTYENALSQDDITSAEAAAGNVLDYELTLSNRSTVGLSQLRLWLDGACSNIELSDDDVTYFSYNTPLNALEIGDLFQGDDKTLYVRRTISAGADSNPGILTHLNAAWSGL